MRKKRNSIIHAVDKNITVSPIELIESILVIHAYFLGEQNWIKSRFNYLDKTPEYSSKYIRNQGYESYLQLQVHKELSIVIGLLTTSKARQFFGYRKKANSYKCPNCYNILIALDFFDPGYHDGFLYPYQKKKDSRNQYVCFVCNYEGTVSGKNCVDEDCHSKLVDAEHGLCLVCGSG